MIRGLALISLIGMSLNLGADNSCKDFDSSSDDLAQNGVFVSSGSICGQKDSGTNANLSGLKLNPNSSLIVEQKSNGAPTGNCVLIQHTNSNGNSISYWIPDGGSQLRNAENDFNKFDADTKLPSDIVVSAPSPCNLVCGTASSGTFADAPTTNLCSLFGQTILSSSTAIDDGSGRWHWGCADTLKTIDCYAAVKNSCLPQTPSRTAPVGQACQFQGPSSGFASKIVPGSANFSWNCPSKSGSSQFACTSPQTVDGLCAYPGPNSIPDSGGVGQPNYCSYQSVGYSDGGSIANFSQSGSAGVTTSTWDCNGLNGGSPVHCIAKSGSCGSADGQKFSQAPTTNLCLDGSTPSVSGTGPWTWTCPGQNGGMSKACSATLAPIKLAYSLQADPSNCSEDLSVTASNTWGALAWVYDPNFTSFALPSPKAVKSADDTTLVDPITKQTTPVSICTTVSGYDAKDGGATSVNSSVTINFDLSQIFTDHPDMTQMRILPYALDQQPAPLEFIPLIQVGSTSLSKGQCRIVFKPNEKIQYSVACSYTPGSKILSLTGTRTGGGKSALSNYFGIASYGCRGYLDNYLIVYVGTPSNPIQDGACGVVDNCNTTDDAICKSGNVTNPHIFRSKPNGEGDFFESLEWYCSGSSNGGKSKFCSCLIN